MKDFVDIGVSFSRVALCSIAHQMSATGGSDCTPTNDGELTLSVRLA